MEKEGFDTYTMHTAKFSKGTILTKLRNVLSSVIEMKSFFFFTTIFLVLMLANAAWCAADRALLSPQESLPGSLLLRS